MWQYGIWSQLVQVMACCLMAPSDYLNLSIICIEWVMSYHTDKLLIDTHTDTQTQATTISKGQNSPRAKTWETWIDEIYLTTRSILYLVSTTSVTAGPVTTRTTRTPAFWGYPPSPHDYPYHGVILDPKSKEDKVKVTNLKNSPKFQIFEFWNGHYTRHTFWSCLIRCANMKWIRWVLLKIQSGHDSVHRRTDGRLRRIWSQLPWSKLHRILASSFLSSSYRVIFVFFI